MICLLKCHYYEKKVRCYAYETTNPHKTVWDKDDGNLAWKLDTLIFSVVDNFIEREFLDTLLKPTEKHG